MFQSVLRIRIRGLFDPWVRDPVRDGSIIKIRIIFPRASKQFFGLLKFFDADADPDPGSGNLFDPEYGIRDGKKFGSGRNIPDPQHWFQCFLYSHFTPSELYAYSKSSYRIWQVRAGRVWIPYPALGLSLLPPRPFPLHGGRVRILHCLPRPPHRSRFVVPFLLKMAVT